MFKSLQSIIPGFAISSENPLPRSKSRIDHWLEPDLKLLVEESNTCGNEFVIYSLLELFLRHNQKVVFVGAANTFHHYSSVLKKLVSSATTLTSSQGINLQSHVASG